MKFLSAIFRRSRMERDMADELRFHLEKRTEDLMRSGVSRAEAERGARIEFGGMEAYKDRCRDASGVSWFDRLRGDVRYAFRTLRAAPGFAAIAILSLALGIGANTTVYRVIDEVLLHDVTADRPTGCCASATTGFRIRIIRTLPGPACFRASPSSGWAMRTGGRRIRPRACS